MREITVARVQHSGTYHPGYSKRTELNKELKGRHHEAYLVVVILRGIDNRDFSIAQRFPSSLEAIIDLLSHR